jgi:hypothetical protein
VTSFHSKKKKPSRHPKNTGIDEDGREGNSPSASAKNKIKIEAAGLYLSAKGYTDSIKAHKQNTAKNACGVLSRPLATAGNLQRQDFLMYVPLPASAQPLPKSRSKVLTAKRGSVTRMEKRNSIAAQNNRGYNCVDMGLGEAGNGKQLDSSLLAASDLL